jgi:hypothetical protein
MESHRGCPHLACSYPLAYGSLTSGSQFRVLSGELISKAEVTPPLLLTYDAESSSFRRFAFNGFLGTTYDGGRRGESSLKIARQCRS